MSYKLTESPNPFTMVEFQSEYQQFFSDSDFGHFNHLNTLALDSPLQDITYDEPLSLTPTWTGVNGGEQSTAYSYQSSLGKRRKQCKNSPSIESSSEMSEDDEDEEEDRSDSYEFPDPSILVGIRKRAQEYSEILLQMVDGKPVEQLVGPKSSQPLDQQLKKFLTTSVEQATRPPQAVELAQDCDDAAWACIIEKRLSKINKKRSDRLLRVFFKKVVKVLLLTTKSEVDFKTQCCKSAVFEQFCLKYSSPTSSDFKRAYLACRNPSFKRLKDLFQDHPLFALDFGIVLRTPRFQQLFLKERKRRALRYCLNFLIAQHDFKSDPNPVSIHLAQVDKFKTFPLSEQDFTMISRRILEILNSISSPFQQQSNS